MKPVGDWYFDESPLYMIGTAHSVSSNEPDDDPAEAVRKVAEEVARRDMPRPARNPIGFVWKGR